MISPCGTGCDVTIAAAIVCYLSFFLSSCSFFLYWYWLVAYRDEINPLEGRYCDPSDSECGILTPEPVDQDDTYDFANQDDETPTTSTHIPEHLQEITNISSCVQHSETDHDLSFTLSSHEHDASVESNLGSVGESDSFIINTITLPLPQGDLDSIQPDHDPDGGPGDPNPESNGDGNQGEGKCAISDNPYLNGNTYSQNLLWGLHGIFTNLVEAILAAVFYSGLFENNLKTTLVWVIGFSGNFIIGNLLYVLLLFYCTNRQKARQLWGRWGIECAFNVGKDLYYIWVGVTFLDNLVHSINPT